MDDGELLRTVADRLEALALRSTAGDWRIGGLLASRPEVVAHGADGAWLRVAAAADPVPEPARAVAQVLAGRLPGNER
jgi:hypothetical protein